MHIEKIACIDSKKSMVTFGNGERVTLYNREINRMNLKQGECISEHDYSYILEELLPKRCRERAFYILERSEKTTSQVREKLVKGGYPSEIIENTLDFLKKYDYLNDARYAHDYICAKSSKKSVKEMTYELSVRGIARDVIKREIEQTVNEEEAIRTLLIKRRFDATDKEKKQKCIQYLLRKGFSYDNILKVTNSI